MQEGPEEMVNGCLKRFWGSLHGRGRIGISKEDGWWAGERHKQSREAHSRRDKLPGAWKAAARKVQGGTVGGAFECVDAEP